MSKAIHRGSCFVVSDDTGDLRPETEDGFFVEDTRFLSRWELRLDGKPLLAMGVSTPNPGEARYFVTNPEVRAASRATVAIRRRRIVARGLHEDLDVENYGDSQVEATLELRIGADFEYVLTVKKQATSPASVPERPPTDAATADDGCTLRLSLSGGDVPRETSIRFGEKPGFLDAESARWALRLAPHERFHVCIDVTVRLADRTFAPGERCGEPGRAQASVERVKKQRAGVCRAAPGLDADHDVLRRAYARAVGDIAELRIKSEGDDVEEGVGAIAAGIPWYMDLFGRDSLIASIESALQDPELLRRTLVALARLQGKKRDETTEEAPGKILHEYRRGPVPPVARKQIPGYPYYGTIDATPWFLIALSEHARVTGNLSLARELWPNALAALEWMSDWGDRDGDGFLEYERESDVGLENQCWKDSGDSMRFRDGRKAEAPIAVVEAQGYAYDACVRVAELARHLGHASLADRLERRASDLRSRIAASYWMEDRSTFALALDAHKRKLDSLTSNPGHLLFCAAVAPDRAKRVAATLLCDEMFSGFGIRTMGSREAAFNPMSYHNGSVWPHDNALALWGFVRYGLVDEAAKLAGAFLDALARFPDEAPPELFCGFSRDEAPSPVPYLQANKPQAWASGAVLLLVRSILGLSIDALSKRVSVRLVPIPGLRRLSFTGVPCGEGRIDVHVDGGRVRVEGVPGNFQLDVPRS